MKKNLILIFALSIIPFYTTGMEKNDPVKEAYAKKLTVAKEKYLFSVEAVKKQMIAEYEKHFAAAMKSKKLDKANEIKQKIDKLKGELPAEEKTFKKEESAKPKPEQEAKPEKKQPVKGKDDFDFGVPQQPK